MPEEKIILITGASTGIGAATARAAAELGHRVVLAARSSDALAKVAADCGGEGRALAVTTDVTSWEQNERLAQSALDQFGRIDVVFANAGFGAERSFSSSGDSVDHWREMVLTNVLGAAYTIRATIDAIRESKGHFLLTGSMAGRVAIPGSLYSATKWAVNGIGQSLRSELNGSGVRVTVINPGVVDTPFFGSPPTAALDDGDMASSLTAADVASSVLYAISQPPHVDVNEILIRPTSQTI